MSSTPPSQSAVDSQVPAVEVSPPGQSAAAAPPPNESRAGVLLQRGVLYLLLVVALLALASSVLLWQKLSNIQEQLARQSADAGNNALEARAMAKQAQELARDAAARRAGFGVVCESRPGLDSVVGVLESFR